MKNKIQCKVELLHHTPLWIGANGARTCWASQDKSDTDTADLLTGQRICGSKDAELLDRVGNKFKHASILEHLSYTFYISGVSRALLQELARHRIASYSVKSTRYTLKELKDYVHDVSTISFISWAKKFCVLTGNNAVDTQIASQLLSLQGLLQQGISNDIAKYALPEAYKTELQWSINARSLQNFLSLRSDKSALWEIRQLAHAVYDTIPSEHQYLFKDHIKEEQNG